MGGIGVAIPANGTDDHFLGALVQSLADPLINIGMSLVTKVVSDEEEEKRLYRHWADVGGISGVALLGAREGDSRVRLLRSLHVPLAAVVDAAVDVDLPAVVVELDASVSVLRAFLATRRHRRAVYVAGPVGRVTALSRAAAIETAEDDDVFEVVRTEHTVGSAVAAGVAALSDGPATLIFDSDVYAVAALAEFRSRGLRVPDDVAIVSWTNSVLCQSASRSITAIDRRGSEIGLLLGERMLGAIAGDNATHVRAPEPFIVVGETA